MNSMNSMYKGQTITPIAIKDMEAIKEELLSILRWHKPKLQQQLLDAAERVEDLLKLRPEIKQYLIDTGQTNEYMLNLARENDEARLNPPGFFDPLLEFFGKRTMPYIDSMATEDQIWETEIDKEIAHGLDVISDIRSGRGFDHISNAWYTNCNIIKQIDMNRVRIVTTGEMYDKTLHTYLDEFGAIEFHSIEFEQPLLRQLATIKAFIKKNKDEI